jgi:hypothetical protein
MSDGYEVDCREGREVSVLTGDYVDEQGNVEFNCPSCEYSILPEDVMQEGGCQCPGCGRTVRLHITADEGIPGWRNVPEESQEDYA